MDNGGSKHLVEMLQKYFFPRPVDEADRQVISVYESRGYLVSFRGPEGNHTASISWLGKSLIEHNNGGSDKTKKW